MRQRLFAGLGALGALGAFLGWGRRQSNSLATIRREAEQRLAPLRRDKAALQSVELAPDPMRPLLVAYPEALAFLETALPALDLEGAAELSKSRGSVLSQHFKATEWPEVKAVDLAVTLTFWTFPGVVALLETFFERYPASLNKLGLTDKKGSLVLTLYGEAIDGSGHEAEAATRPS